MKDELLRIESKIDKITDSLSEIKIIQAAQATDLKYHIKRTDLLEQKLEPIEDHVSKMHGALKLIGIIALLGGILGGIAEFLMYLKGTH